ncbi:MAG: hypothetical protein ISQ07_06880 [Pirellulales bacterium]|jgi:membrane protease subunit HflK|nr:hypothetical protein [Pirellulales bacterium]
MSDAEPVLDTAPELDPAQQSLADALAVSFTVLKFAMLAAVFAYAFSGVFSVGSNEVALRLRFGNYVGAPGERVLERGTYFAAPFPIEQVIKVDTRPNTLKLDKDFWYETGMNERGTTRDQIRNTRAGPLNPMRDGSLLTGDVNVAHAQWTITYIVGDPVAYVTNVGQRELADQLIKCIVAQGIIRAIAQLPADDLLKGLVNREVATATAQETLDAMASGLQITQLALDQVSAPVSVVASFDAVTTAETDRARRIVQAQQDRARILGEAAGQASDSLIALLDEYERVRETGTSSEIAVSEQKLKEVFDTLTVNNISIGGLVAESINSARTYRTQVVEAVKGDREVFERLLPQFEKNPRIILSRLWEDARERILTGDVETFYTLDGRLELQINRDPQIQQDRQKSQIEALKQRQAEFN